MNQFIKTNPNKSYEKGINLMSQLYGILLAYGLCNGYRNLRVFITRQKSKSEKWPTPGIKSGVLENRKKNTADVPLMYLL